MGKELKKKDIKQHDHHHDYAVDKTTLREVEDKKVQEGTRVETERDIDGKHKAREKERRRRDREEKEYRREDSKIKFRERREKELRREERSREQDEKKN